MSAREGSSPSPRRSEVLNTLRAANGPLGVVDIAEAVAIHVNTARFHLDALADSGSVERTLEPPSGPGRPRTVYSYRPGMDRDGSRNYAMLAEILLSQLAAAGPASAKAAEQSGRAWGHFLIDRATPFRQLTRSEATARLIALLEDLGFAPEAEESPRAPSVIRLRHCPFLELAEKHGPIVCRIHLGLMRGALAELRAPVAATDLKPFAEPDACLTQLKRARVA